jgi:UDP-glucose 4-epimerase
MDDATDADGYDRTTPGRWTGLAEPELAGATVLVTGGAGFIGSHLVDALAPVADVRVLDRFSTGDANDLPAGVAVHGGDVTDRADVATAMADVDVVFHEAALVSVPESVERPVESHETNVGGTVNVLDAARREGARVVLASSAAVYGQPATVPTPETAPLAPASPYGADKVAADRYATAYGETYDVPTVSLRYFNVYGPRQGGEYAGVVDAFLERAMAGEPLTVHGDGSQTRDFVHVADVVQANLRAAITDATGRAYNVGTGHAVSIRDLAETVVDVTDSASSITHTDPRPGDLAESCADVSRAREHLGYRPTVDLETGLADLVAHRRTHRRSARTGPSGP